MGKKSSPNTSQQSAETIEPKIAIMLDLAGQPVTVRIQFANEWMNEEEEKEPHTNNDINDQVILPSIECRNTLLILHFFIIIIYLRTQTNSIRRSVWHNKKRD